MTDRAAQLRNALMHVFADLEGRPTAYADIRKHLEPVVDALFSGQDVTLTFLQVSMTGALRAYWAKVADGINHPKLLAKLNSLYSLVLTDPTRVAAIAAEIPREIAPCPLVASSAPPLSYVLDEGAIALVNDPDPDPERDVEENAGAESNAPESNAPESNAPESNALVSEEPAPGNVESTSAAVLAPIPTSVAVPGADFALDEVAAEPVLLYRYYRDVAASAFDNLSLIARHRRERRLSESDDEEEWIVQLSDAIACIGLEALTAARRHFIEHLATDPADLWGSTFFLGCVQGLPAARLLDELGEALNLAPESAAAIAADALSLGSQQELMVLLRDWAVSPVAAKRAIAIAVQCTRQELSPEGALRGLHDPSRTVRLLTLRSLRSLEVGTLDLGLSLLSALRSQWHVADAELVWQAVRTTCWFGLGEAYRAWRRGELVGLGDYELDLIVLAGDAQDLTRVRTLVESSELNPRTLRQLACYGHPAVIPVLIHGLKDDELQSDAAASLETLLGFHLDSDARLDPNEWARILSGLRIRPDERLWLGKPYRPSTFLREVEHGRSSLVELERTLEEIRGRTGRRFSTALGGWSSAIQGRLGAICSELPNADRVYPAGSWSCTLNLTE